MIKGKMFLTALLIGIATEEALQALDIDVYYNGPEIPDSPPYPFSTGSLFIKIGRSHKHEEPEIDLKHPNYLSTKLGTYTIPSNLKEIGPFFFVPVPTAESSKLIICDSTQKDGKVPLQDANQQALSKITAHLHTHVGQSENARYLEFSCTLTPDYHSTKSKNGKP